MNMTTLLINGVIYFTVVIIYGLAKKWVHILYLLMWHIDNHIELSRTQMELIYYLGISTPWILGFLLVAIVNGGPVNE